jgi:hypothetical protein
MKPFIFTVFISFLFCSFILLSLSYWIKQDVLRNIELAENKYNSHGEEALISYLEDEKNSYHDRTHIAIWTLGKIRSQKSFALEVMLRNDHSISFPVISNRSISPVLME